jgi:hypothetical protein
MVSTNRRLRSTTWSGWYAGYIVARQNGKTPEEAAKEGKLHIEGALAA